jgi:hypothetical protein
MSDALLDELRALIQQDVNKRGLACDPHENLFTACHDDFAAACRSIADTPQASVAVVTGFFIPHAQPPCGETDGPLGALFLARAFSSLGIPIVIFTDAFCLPALEIGLRCTGLSENSVRILPAGWVEERDPPFSSSTTHLLALERVGPSFDGRCRNMHGRDVTDEMAPAHRPFEDARSKSPIVTIGIGDGGNEIGMGKIAAATIARNIPNGERIACRVAADFLIVAGVSNWGAYALAAGVALLRRQPLPNSLFDSEGERELLRLMVERGPLVDGVSGRQTVSVDGLSFDDYVAPLRRIGEMMKRARQSS